MAPPPGLPATTLEEFSSTKEKFSKNHYILREIASGSFGTVFVSIRKEDADKIIAKHPSSSTTDLFAELRRNMQATKISKALDMSDEIAFLSSMKNIVCAESKNASQNLPYLYTAETLESNKTSLWLNMELLEGGTLHKFYEFQLQQEQLGRPPLPVSLLWHWLAQMAHTFMYLHLSLLPDGSTDKDFIPLVHNDLHWGNIMIRPPKTTTHDDEDFHDYPDLVLSDFGNAMTWENGKAFVNRKEKNILDFQIEFEQFLEHVDHADVDFEGVFKREVSFRSQLGSDGADRKEREFLQGIVEVAERKKRELYKPLSKEVREYFQRPIVTDKELEDFVMKVRKERDAAERSDSAGSSDMDDEKTAGCGCKTM